jgi:hypothetical protein
MQWTGSSVARNFPFLDGLAVALVAILPMVVALISKVVALISMVVVALIYLAARFHFSCLCFLA